MARLPSREAHDRALAAAADIVGERGIIGVTVDEVASRSGVAKTTIYRHWPNRVDLVVDALRTVAGVASVPATGDLQADVQACFVDLVAKASDPAIRRKMVAVVQAADQNPEFEEVHRALLEERLRPLRAVLSDGQARGELPPDVDVELAADLLVGPLMFRLLMRRAPVGPEELAAVVDYVVTGLQARRPHGALPRG